MACEKAKIPVKLNADLSHWCAGGERVFDNDLDPEFKVMASYDTWLYTGVRVLARVCACVSLSSFMLTDERSHNFALEGHLISCVHGK
jgi:hypothetical protein